MGDPEPRERATTTREATDPARVFVPTFLNNSRESTTGQDTTTRDDISTWSSKQSRLRLHNPSVPPAQDRTAISLLAIPLRRKSR